MTMYFSPSTKGFFDTAFHGERRIEVVDEAAYDRAIATAGAMDKAAFEAACDGWVADGEDGSEPVEANYRENLMAVDDAPPMMWIDNPACTVPADAVEIAPERHAKLLAAQAAGQVIAAGDTGHPEASDRPFDREAWLQGLRARRDKALRASDWSEFSRRLSATAKKKWHAYRDALFDLPGKATAALDAGADPASIEFPEAPA